MTNGKRLLFIVEGHSEENFVNRVLVPHLGQHQISASAHRIPTSKQQRGGLVNYLHLKNRVIDLLSEHKNAFVTTMVDFYRLPKNFPQPPPPIPSDPIERVKAYEVALALDINETRYFIPYIQCHEFESLLFADIGQLSLSFGEPEYQPAIERLTQILSQFPSPEHINQGDQTAPSKRIINEIPRYQNIKRSDAPIIAECIGLDKLRSTCKHFDEWIAKLEQTQ